MILMQYLPFADSKALAVYDAFEQEVYKLVRQRTYRPDVSP